VLRERAGHGMQKKEAKQKKEGEFLLWAIGHPTKVEEEREKPPGLLRGQRIVPIPRWVAEHQALCEPCGKMQS